MRMRLPFMLFPVWLVSALLGPLNAGESPSSTTTTILDGQWSLAVDPQNVGRQQKWFEREPVAPAKPAKVPWIIQEAFPGYHGVAWYWRDFAAPEPPREPARYLLRFWAVDYKADVWLNGVALGGHEGGETPFVLDASKAIRPGQRNRLTVRVLNPTHQAIDGIVLNETPHRNKVIPYGPGSAWDQGGIMDSVALLVTPQVRIADLFVQPDWKTGDIAVRVTINNAAGDAAAARLDLTVGPAAAGETLAVAATDRTLPAGDSLIQVKLHLDQPRPWDLSDPYLYRVTARINRPGVAFFDEQSVCCGFRDFRFEKGAFRLNGRRIFLRCSHTGNCCPIGLEMPHDPDFLRRDLINAKAMRFNAIRFISGVAKRYQLDLCDEIGLMVYEEPYAAWCMVDSPKFAQRYDDSVLGMVLRDRNHPSVTMWGLLNETPDGPVFRHALGFLSELRGWDDSRMVMLNSGRWDNQEGQVAEIQSWHPQGHDDPCVTFNPTGHTIKALGITWAPGQLAFHPGRKGQYAVVRWTAAADDTVNASAVFTSIAEHATTDVHVLHNGHSLYAGFINLHGAGAESKYLGAISVHAGDTFDCICGFGNNDYGADTTAVSITVRSSAGQISNAAREFSSRQNPNGPWSYGQCSPGPIPKAETFVRFPSQPATVAAGSLSNPGSKVWEDVLDDKHPYQGVPHTAGIIQTLRTLGKYDKPLFISEYGIGSAVDLLRVVRLYEQAGKADADDAQYYRQQRDRFLADWQRWKMSGVFDRPEDFFAQSNARMASQRLLGLNAIRANPNVVGHSVTGTVDQGMTGEGLWTTFRELKPGTVDAVFDGLAPLRWCLFAEPVNFYRGAPVRLEALLANEDALPAGQYPVRLQVAGPDTARVWEQTVTLSIPATNNKSESPLVLPVFDRAVVIDGPAGKYRFSATFQRGAAAAGESVEFYVAAPLPPPGFDAEVVVWGDDAGLIAWLREHGMRSRQFSSAVPTGRELILAAARPPAPGGATAFAELARRMARGATVVFLSPAVFAQGNDKTAWLPLARKGNFTGLPSWLYHKDEWAKQHAIFDDLPAGGLLDYTFYRELIPQSAFIDLDPPAETVAAAIDASCGYSSGLLVAVYPLGAGEFVLNSLQIRENLGRHPAADRLLLNMLRFAAHEMHQPLAPLPADFEGQLKGLKYQSGLPN